MNSVLVTGASGQVGREVVRSLLARGRSVIAADRASPSGDIEAAAGVKRVVFDFRDRGTWEPALAGSGLLLAITC